MNPQLYFVSLPGLFGREEKHLFLTPTKDAAVARAAHHRQRVTFACSLALSYPHRPSAMLNPTNGHFYDINLTNVTGNSAIPLAASSSYLGVTGHAVTITSADEDMFVHNLATSYNATKCLWIGLHGVQLNSSTNVWDWRWAVGPEVNQTSNYTMWSPDAPVNNTADQCGLICPIRIPTTGAPTNWTNRLCDSTNVTAYVVVEYECEPGYSFGPTACQGGCRTGFPS